MPIGISHRTIKPYTIDLKKNLINCIFANNLQEFDKFLINLVEIIRKIKNINFVVLDAEDILQGKKESNKDKYINLFKNLNSSKNIKDTVIFIIGVDKFITELGSEDLFFESLKNAQALKNVII